MPYQKTKEGRLVNEITLGDGYPLSNDLQPLKIGGEASVIEISHPLPDGSDKGLFKVNGDLDITGTLKTKLSHDLIYDFDDEVNTLAQAKVDALIDSAPAALDTLNELAAALNDDASFSTTITNSLATKVGLTGDETVAGHKKFSDDVLIAGAAADPATDDEVSLGVSAAQFRVHTNYGYVQIGPANTNWSHFYTDRDRYYFNKPVIVDGEYIASYNEDLVLRRVYNDSSYNQITLGDDSFELKLDNTVRLAIDGDGDITTGSWKGSVIASAYLDSDTAHLSGTQTFTGLKTFTEPITIHTDTDAVFNLKSSDDSWAYMQFLQNDGDRIGYIGFDSDQDRLIINANENGANEVQIDTTTVDINANVDISGNITAGAITSGFGNIDIGSSTLDAGDTVLAGDLRVGDGTEGIRLLNISSNIAGIYGVDTGGSAWNSIHIKADGNDGLFIEKDTNKVGIGTTSPTEPLEVWSANSQAYHYPIVARNPYNSASNLNYGVGIKLQLDDGNENKWASIAYEADSAYGNSGDLKFYVDGASNTTQRMKLSHEGGLSLRHGGWNGITVENVSNTNGSHIELKNTERRFQVAVRSNGFDIRDVTASDTSRFFINSSGTASFQDNDITNVGDISVDKIKADTASDVNIMFNTSGMTFNVETGDSYQFNLGEVDADLVYYDSEESDLFKIDSGNKRVGIGLSSPTTTLDVEGTVSYKHTSLTDSSDNLDVSGVTVVECTPSGTDRLGGLVGGVQGQILYILKVDSGFGRIIIEHNEGTGNQDIFLSGGADVQLSTRGGMTLYCNGTSWFALDK